MARRHALIAGFGTTGILVACAALLLAVAGALFGFRAWPGDQTVDGSPGMSVGTGRILSAEPPSFAGAPVPDEVREALRSPRRRVSRPARAERARQRVAGVRARGGRGASDSGPALASPGGSQGGSNSPGGAGGQRVSEQLAGTVEQIGRGVAGVGETATPAGEIVRDTGTAVSGTVRQLGGNVEAQVKLP